MDIFISYAREDQKQAERIRKLLLTIPGVDPWMDIHKILGGADWNREINIALENSDIVLLLLSRNSVDKTGFIQKEVREALDLSKNYPPGKIFLIPIRLDDCTPSHLELKKLNWVDMFDDWDYGLSRIKITIEKLISQDNKIGVNKIFELTDNDFGLQSQKKIVAKLLEFRKIGVELRNRGDGGLLHEASIDHWWEEHKTWRESVAKVIELEDNNLAEKWRILGTFTVRRNFPRALSPDHRHKLQMFDAWLERLDEIIERIEGEKIRKNNKSQILGNSNFDGDISKNKLQSLIQHPTSGAIDEEIANSNNFDVRHVQNLQKLAKKYYQNGDYDNAQTTLDTVIRIAEIKDNTSNVNQKSPNGVLDISDMFVIPNEYSMIIRKAKSLELRIKEKKELIYSYRRAVHLIENGNIKGANDEILKLILKDPTISDPQNIFAFRHKLLRSVLPIIVEFGRLFVRLEDLLGRLISGVKEITTNMFGGVMVLVGFLLFSLLVGFISYFAVATVLDIAIIDRYIFALWPPAIILIDYFHSNPLLKFLYQSIAKKSRPKYQRRNKRRIRLETIPITGWIILAFLIGGIFFGFFAFNYPSLTNQTIDFFDWNLNIVVLSSLLATFPSMTIIFSFYWIFRSLVQSRYY